MTSHPLRTVLAAVACILFWGQPDHALSQDGPGRATETRLTIWDLPLGAHARDLPREAFADFACGTNGGPPSLPLLDWTEYARCRPEPDTGLHEVYFRYDDEQEYLSRAIAEEGMVFRNEGTTEFSVPIIVSGLFDDQGFLRGRRVVTDPRVEPDLRERGSGLAGRFSVLFGDAGWTCADLPPGEGETPYRGSYINQRCTKDLPDQNAGLTIEKRYFRKEGQQAIDPVTRQPTTGYFVSESRLVEMLTELPDENRTAALQPHEKTPRELLAEKAMDCPGCDLAGADLKRAHLSGANLAGANLAGANLHGVDLSAANLAGANLSGANLNRADLRRATLTDADVTNTYLFHAFLSGGDISGADFSGARAGEAEFVRVRARGARFVATDLRLARLSDADLAGADFSGSRLNDAQLGRANLAGATLIRTLLWRASLISVDLTGAVAQEADFSAAIIRDANLTDADFSGARLATARFSGTTTTGAIFDDAILPNGFPGQ